MYDDPTTFREDFMKAQDMAIARYPKTQEFSPEFGFKVYRNARYRVNLDRLQIGDIGLPMMIFGRHQTSIMKSAIKAHGKRQEEIFRRDKRLKDSSFVPQRLRQYITVKASKANMDEWKRAQNEPGIDTDKNSPVMKNFGIINNDEVGSILLMADNAQWSATLNDTWLLGAVHAGLPFYPASTLSRAGIFSDDEFVLRITGRELFGLAIFGYGQVNPEYPELGTAFEVVNPKVAAKSTLLEYQEAMNDITKQKAEKAFRDAGFRISKVGI